MNPTAVLSPEIVDLGLALGLLTGSGGSVSFDSDWFSDPGSKAASALADDDRRAALVRFVDAVNGEGGAAESGGVTFLKVFAAADLGTAGAPDLTVSVSIDDRPSTYVEVGVALEHATTAPATRTRLVVPLYRTGKSTNGGPVAAVAEPFALAAGSPIRLSSSIATNGGPADPSGFRLDAVQVAAEVPVAGGDPSVELALLGLRLPGATAPTDIRIGGPDSDIEEALLSLVLGVVRAGATALGPAGATVMAALDLIGLGPDALVPALDVDGLVQHGASAFRTWFAATMATTAPRTAWLGALADVVGGTVQDGRLVVDLGPVDLTVEIVARPGAGGHLEVTPRIGLELAGLLGAGPGAVRLGVAAVVDVLTVDVVDGGLTAVPKAELLVSLAGNGARLLPTGPVQIGGVQVGLGLDAGDLVPVLRALDVQVGSDPPHAVVNLSSADAVVAAAGQLAGQLVGSALDALGDTGAHLKALLGLTPPAGVDPLDAAALLTDPLAALRGWWQGLLGDPDPAKARAVLDHVVALLGQNPAAGTTGVGTAAAPYSIPVLQSPAFSLDVWREGSTLIVAPTLSKRFSDLAGGCTLVVTTVRAELAAVDLATGQLSLLRSAELSTAFRGRGSTEARLALGPVALVAQRIGFAARWSAAAGFRFGLDAPGLAADLGTATVPLELPTGAGWQAAALTDVENLVGVLGVTNPSGWLHDLVDLLGWTFGAEAHPHRLGLAALVADPGAELTRWGRALLTDEVLVGRLASALARLLTGSTTGRAGILDGRGTPSDPWVLPLGSGAGAPALSLAIGPDGPRIAPSTTTDALRTWRPGRPGLAPVGLARAVLDEGLAGDDTAALARGRGQLGTGLEALVVRVTGTDVMVAPPPSSSPVAGVAVSTHPSMLWTAWPGLAAEVALKGPVPAGAAVVRVAVGTAASHPWTGAPAGRLVDLSAPGLAPESFTVTAPDGGDWFVVLATRADAAVGTGDPTGVAGQAARLRRVVSALGAGRPVVLMAVGGAGHAARLAADAEASVGHLVTLGTPWTPVAFDTARDGVSADALRLLEALLPATDPAEPDDPDLATGRALVEGLRHAAVQADLEAPRPETAVRPGLAVRAWFGALDRPAVERAVTAVVAAGLAARARARAEAAAAPGLEAHLALRLPVPPVVPAGGTGVVVEGHVAVGLTGAAFADGTVGAAPGVEVHLALSEAGGWLLGGPGTVPSAGASPLEVRWMEVRILVGSGGGPSRAGLVLHEAAALGARRDRIVVRPDAGGAGSLEDLPFLPEARAIAAGVATRLRAGAAGSAAAALATLLDAVGLTTSAGLVPDALTHLLHDPAAFAGSAMAAAPSRTALATALAALVPGASRTGDAVTVTFAGGETSAAVTLDLSTRRVAVTAASTAGALPWAAAVEGLGGPAPTGTVTIGSPSFNTAAVRIGLVPFTVALAGETAPGQPGAVSLWPDPDLEGLRRFAAAALPAEAVRLLLEALRGIDPVVGPAIELVAGALGLLAPPDASGRRAVVPPLGLLRDPGAWFRSAVLGDPAGTHLDAVTDLFEAVKPFLGLAGTPRGTWPVAPGLALTVAASAGGPRIGLAVGPTAWLTGDDRPPFAAGIDLGLTLTASGPPLPAVAVFAGLPEATPSGAHRRAVHAALDAAGLVVFLRPAAGADIPLHPNPAGLGALLAAGVEQLLPMVLDALARLSGDANRLAIGALVSAVGRGLDVVADPDDTANPATFDGAKLHLLADDPGARLAARAGALAAEVASRLDPLIAQLPGSPHAAFDAGSATLTVTVRSVTLTLDPSPLAFALDAAVTHPVVGAVQVSVGAGAAGLTQWGFGLGPAAFDLGGPVLRPRARGGWDGASGWEIELGLALDGDPPTTSGHKELFGRWREADGFAMVARTRTGGGNDDATGAGEVALFAADAVLELLGNWVVELDDVATLLDTPVGASSVRLLLEGSILSGADNHKLLPAPVSRLPGSLFLLARNLAGAGLEVELGPLTLATNLDGNTVGLRLGIDDPAGIELNPGGDVVLSLVADSTWIEPPAGDTPAAGLVVDIVSITAADPPVVTVDPAIAVNGVGLRIAKASGPLLDAGLRIESAALHLFGRLESDGGSGAAVSGGVQVELAGLAVPLGAGGGANAVAQGVMKDAGGSGAPPTPKFSPALAVQSHHGGNGVSVSLRAGSGDGPWYLPIQRAFGPVYLEQIGLGTGYTGNPPATPRRLDWISVSLDGSVSLFGITASVDKLRLTYHVNQPFFSASSWEADLDGFAIASSIGGLTLAGALRRSPLSPPLQGMEYLGMLKVGYGGYGLDLFGGYAHPTGPSGSFASFFAFGALHAPLGGVPAFFITGIGLGFGINRELATPTIDTITTNPFMVAMKAIGTPPDPMVQLEQMRTQIKPAQGQFWIAAGISFTSFVLISGEVVVTVEFGDGLDITVLGLARVELPAPSLTLVSIELALLARFSTKEGALLVQAQLTENSWLLMRSVRLTGGFAFATWWKGPNAGQVVVTMGGYHPKFHHDGYPTVPRLGLRWQPISNVSVIGESYFALCSEALMAGTSMEVSARFGPAYAHLSYGGDGIVFFDPFWFMVSAWAEIRAGIRLWLLFGTVDVEVSLGAWVEVTGPPIHVEGRFEICGFEVPFEFGDEGNPADNALTAGQFRDKYLRASSDAQVIQAAVVRGAVASGQKAGGQQQKVPDGSPTNPFLVIPEFQVVFITTAPAIDMALRHAAKPQERTLSVPAPGVGVAPMYSHTLDSDFHVELSNLNASADFSITGVSLAPRPPAAFPKGLWGEAPNPQSPRVPAGEVVPASDGFTASTALGEFTGAPAIDYHQVELPFGGRKPLPFVTNQAAANQRLAAAAQLKAIAEAVKPAAADVDQRFNYAARVLDAGGYGTVGVAALRGERATPPAFGSLADDMATAPQVESTTVNRVVVDRRPAARPFVGPLVKALVQAPLSRATARPPHTTVADRSAGVRFPVPSLDRMRSDVTRIGPASLLVRPTVGELERTVLPRGAVPPTRLTTSPLAAVANARPGPAGAERLAALSKGLPEGVALGEGELVVVTIASRPTERGERLVVGGGATRVVALAAGGNVLFDNVDPGSTALTGFSRAGKGVFELPVKTERVVVAALGDRANVGGTLDGWYAGQSLPLVGWDMALGAGVIVTFAHHKARPNRDRRDGGWCNTRDLVRAARVATRFDAPVRAVAVAVEDASVPDGAVDDAASSLEMRLIGATRVLDAGGEPVRPRMLVQGLRTILIYEVEPQPVEGVLDPNVTVMVEGTRHGFLAGVAGTTGSVDELATVLTTAGFDAAVAAPLPGGTGTRTIQWQSSAAAELRQRRRGPAARAAVRKARPARKAAAKKGAVKKAVPVKKAAVKKAAPVKKAAVKKAAPVKKAAVKKAAPVKKAAVKKAAPVKKAAVKKAAPVKKAVPVKKAGRSARRTR